MERLDKRKVDKMDLWGRFNEIVDFFNRAKDNERIAERFKTKFLTLDDSLVWAYVMIEVVLFLLDLEYVAWWNMRKLKVVSLDDFERFSMIDLKPFFERQRLEVRDELLKRVDKLNQIGYVILDESKA